MTWLWANGSGTVSEVKDGLGDPLAYTTVLTILRNLEAKGFLTREDEGRAHRYFPRVQQKAARKRSLEDRIADVITSFSGRMVFAYVHIVWFTVWILLNTGRLGLPAFDPFPYGLLTMIVSLEAIFLSTFVLISQNRLSAEAERRADLDLHVGMLTEHELTRVLQMLDAIQDRMGIANDGDGELADLEKETKPEDVLAEIDRLELRALLGKKLRGGASPQEP